MGETSTCIWQWYFNAKYNLWKCVCFCCSEALRQPPNTKSTTPRTILSTSNYKKHYTQNYPVNLQIQKALHPELSCQPPNTKSTTPRTILSTSKYKKHHTQNYLVNLQIQKAPHPELSCQPPNTKSTTPRTILSTS